MLMVLKILQANNMSTQHILAYEMYVRTVYFQDSRKGKPCSRIAKSTQTYSAQWYFQTCRKCRNENPGFRSQTNQCTFYY